MDEVTEMAILWGLFYIRGDTQEILLLLREEDDESEEEDDG